MSIGSALMGSSPVEASKEKVILVDTMPGNQVNPCFGRPIQGGTTNGYEKGAATLTTSERVRVTKVKLPLTVDGSEPGTVQVTIVGSRAFESDPTGSGYWSSIPDEAVELGRTTAEVSTTTAPCAQPEIVTARFNPAVRLKPDQLYWVVVQDAAGSQRSYFWAASTSLSDEWTHAIFIRDGNGARWVSYDPGTFAPNALRVIGR
ncbi:MAG: hypothetical protein R2761_00600 [Acidimicrobiales bacterium]